MDCDGYPEDDELEAIREWPYTDLEGLLEYVRPRFKYSEPGGWCSWHRRGNVLRLHTGGWSGNESIMGALQENTMFWMICWRASWRGGHYSFDLSRILEAK